MPASVAPTAEPAAGHLRPTSAGWEVGFGVEPPVRLAASRGLCVLRHLIATAGRPVLAVELERIADGAPPLALGEDDVRLLLLGVDLDTLRAELLDDRARSRISKLLRRTVGRLADQHATLGRHLRSAVTTGRTCRYTAPPGVAWNLGE